MPSDRQAQAALVASLVFNADAFGELDCVSLAPADLYTMADASARRIEDAERRRTLCRAALVCRAWAEAIESVLPRVLVVGARGEDGRTERLVERMEDDGAFGEHVRTIFFMPGSTPWDGLTQRLGVALGQLSGVRHILAQDSEQCQIGPIGRFLRRLTLYGQPVDSDLNDILDRAPSVDWLQVAYPDTPERADGRRIVPLHAKLRAMIVANGRAGIPRPDTSALERLVLYLSWMNDLRSWFDDPQHGAFDRLRFLDLRNVVCDPTTTGAGLLATLPPSLQHLRLSLALFDPADYARVVATMYADFASPSVLPNLRIFDFDAAISGFVPVFAARPGVTINVIAQGW